MLNIIFVLLVAGVTHYVASATGMGSFEAVATTIVIGGVAGTLSWYRKPVAKVAGIGTTLGALGSTTVQILASRQGTGVQLEYVYLFAAIVGLLCIVGYGLWIATGLVFRHARR